MCSFMTFLPMSAVLMLHALDQYSRMMCGRKPEMLSLHSMLESPPRPPQELRIHAWLQTQDSSALVEQAVRNLSNSQRELNAQKILRPTNLCFSKTPQHRYMSVVY